MTSSESFPGVIRSPFLSRDDEKQISLLAAQITRLHILKSQSHILFPHIVIFQVYPVHASIQSRTNFAH